MCRLSCTELVVVGTDGVGDRTPADGEAHIPDAMAQRLEALAKRLAIEQKVSGIYCLVSLLALCFRGITALVTSCSGLSSVLIHTKLVSVYVRLFLYHLIC